jgi:hypothetical protein
MAGVKQYPRFPQALLILLDILIDLLSSRTRKRGESRGQWPEVRGQANQKRLWWVSWRGDFERLRGRSGKVVGSNKGVGAVGALTGF